MRTDVRALGRSRWGFTLVELLAVVSIIGVLVALVLPGVQKARAAARRLQCASQLRQIGISLHARVSDRGTLPPGMSFNANAGQFRYMGWQAHILPQIEQHALWHITVSAFHAEPEFFRNPPHVGLATVVPLYACPSDARLDTPKQVPDIEVAFTSYLGNAGLNEYSKDGVLYADSAVRPVDISDGLSTTHMAGERPPAGNFAFGWWYAGIGQENNGSCDMVLGVRELNRRDNRRRMKSCENGPYRFASGEFANPCDMFHFWSAHGAGSHFLLCDGSVHFWTYTADSVLPALATRSGSEAASISD